MEHSAQQRIAKWNPERDCWESDDLDLISGLPVVWSETWPASGMTHDGSAYELPTSRLVTGATESSSLLPTPQTSDTNGPGSHGDGGEDLRTAVSLLPTPTSRDGKGPNQRQDETCLHGALLPTPPASAGEKGGPNQRGSSGDMMLPSAVMLLPTPAVNDMGEGKTPEAWDLWTATQQEKHANGNGHGKSLAIEAMRLLPTPIVGDSTGSCRLEGQYNYEQLRDVATLLGVSMDPPSDVGNGPSDDRPQHLPSPDEPATHS